MARAKPPPGSFVLRLPAPAYIILEEDEYETKLGDGRFVYLLEAYWDDVLARSRMKELKERDLHWRFGTGGYSLLHTLKPIELSFDGENVVCDLPLGQDEHYTLEKIVELLSKQG